MIKPNLISIASPLLVLLFLTLSPASSSAKVSGNNLLLLYSNDVHGETEACG